MLYLHIYICICTVLYQYLYPFWCIIDAMFETQGNTKIKTIRLGNGT